MQRVDPSQRERDFILFYFIIDEKTGVGRSKINVPSIYFTVTSMIVTSDNGKLSISSHVGLNLKIYLRDNREFVFYVINNVAALLFLFGKLEKFRRARKYLKKFLFLDWNFFLFHFIED